MVHKIGSTKFQELLPLVKQTYYIPFLWALTWYLFWIVRDLIYWRGVNSVNVVAAIASACVVLSAVAIRRRTHKYLRRIAPQFRRSIHRSPIFLGSRVRKTDRILPVSVVPRNQIPHTSLIEDSPQQSAVVEAKEQVAEPEAVAETLESEPAVDVPQELPPKTNGCPKNLDYYTQKPRPKQTPEECLTCKNLISCVCLTSK